MARPKKTIKVTPNNLSPLPGFVLVQPKEVQKQTESGIYLPDSSDEKPQEGLVLAVGDTWTTEQGAQITPPVKKDDVVIYKKWGGNDVKIADVEYQFLKWRKSKVQEVINSFTETLAKAGIAARVVGEAPMFDVVFTAEEVRDYRSAIGDREMAARYNRLMRQRGILKGESKFYVSMAHTAEDVRFTLDAFADAIAELATERAA